MAVKYAPRLLKLHLSDLGKPMSAYNFIPMTLLKRALSNIFLNNKLWTKFLKMIANGSDFFFDKGNAKFEIFTLQK